MYLELDERTSYRVLYGRPEVSFSEAVCCRQYPAIIQQRSTAVEVLVADWNLVKQHATRNLSLKRHQPRPFAFREPFSANQSLHNAVTATDTFAVVFSTFMPYIITVLTVIFQQYA